MRGTPKHTISAKNFVTPLLLTLGRLSGFKPDVVIRSDATYEPICADMGITIDQFGKPNGINTFSTVRWIQAAFKVLITKGWAAREGRGTWKLTPDGVSKAQSLRDKESPLGDKRNENTTGAGTAMPLPVSQGHEETEEYHEDAFIRGLAIEQTPCYGAYSDKSETCSDCPVKNRCLNALAAHLSRLANMLALEDAAPEVAKKQPGPAVQPAKTANPPRPVTSGATSMSGEIQKIICQQKSLCKKCGTEVSQGEDAIWIRSTQVTQKQPGIYHVHCYEEN